MQTNSPMNKIIGHHPGRMNKITEEVIGSDFTAGRSWTHVKDALALMGVKTGVGKKAIQSGLKEWSKLSPEQMIKNIRKSGTKVTSVALSPDRAAEYNSILNRIRYDPKKILSYADKKVTLAHEVLEKVYAEKEWGRRRIPGMLRELFGIKSKTKLLAPKDVLSGKSVGFQHMDVGVITGEMRFAKATGVDFSETVRRHKNIFNEKFLTKKDKFFTKGYKKILNIGGADKPILQEVKTEAISMAEYNRILGARAHENLVKSVSNTVGLTNKVMHENRTQHQIMDIWEKTKHLFNI